MSALNTDNRLSTSNGSVISNEIVDDSPSTLTSGNSTPSVAFSTFNAGNSGFLSSRFQGFDKRSFLKDVGEIELKRDESIDLSIRIMDMKYNTTFYEWIKNPENIDYTAHHMKRIVKDYNTQIIGRGFRWLFKDWYISSIASLLIKIYYEQGLENESFTQVVNELCRERSWAKVVDLLATLIIGEDACITATFLNQVTQEWNVTVVIDLIQAISARSRWQNNFMEEFIVHFASTRNSMAEFEQKRLVKQIRKKFEDRRYAMDIIPSSVKHISIASHRVFSKQILESMLLNQNCEKVSVFAPAESVSSNTGPSAGPSLSNEISFKESYETRGPTSAMVVTPTSSPLSIVSLIKSPT